MKNLLLLLFFPLCFVSFEASATIVGAEFEWEALGKDTFLIKINAYRDCNGGGILTRDITVTTKCGTKQLSPKTVSMGDVTPVCAGVQSRCKSRSTSFKYGFELFQLSAIYVATTDIRNGCCIANLSWKQCCRSQYITTGSASENLYIEAALNFCAGASAVKWSSPAVAIGCLGTDQYLDNSLVTTDSVVYSCTDPLSSATTKTTWSYPYSACKPVYYPSFPKRNPKLYQLDSTTGEHRFRAFSQQVTILCVQAEIFRNGQLIGFTRRDIQYIVVKCPSNFPPVLSSMDAKKPVSKNFTASVCAGKKLCFSVTPTDPDKNDTVTLEQNNGIARATFTITNPGTTRDTGVFCWTPTTSDISNTPHKVVIKAKDNACPSNAISSRVYSILVQKPYSYDLDMKVRSGKCGTYYMTVSDKNGLSMNEIDWYENDSIYIGSGDSLAHTFTSIGNRKVTVRVSDCLDQQADTIINVTAVSKIQLAMANANVCQNEKVQLTPTITGQSGSLQYHWNIVDVASGDIGYKGNTTDSTIHLNFKNQSTLLFPIILSVQDSLGCTAIDTVNILSKKNTYIDLEKDQMICEGDVSELNLSQHQGQGNWSGTNVVSNKMNLGGLSTGIYTLRYKLEDSLSCKSDTASIYYRTAPVLSISNNFSNCTNSNETIQLTQSPTGGQWTGTGLAGNVFVPSIAGKGLHYLSYSYTDSLGCSNADSLLATVYDYAPGITVTDSIKACNNDDVLTITAQPSGGAWLGPGVTSTSNAIQVDPSLLSSGNRTYVYVFADSNSCTNSDSTVLSIADAPVAGFQIIDSVSFIGDSVFVQNQSTGGSSLEYIWKIGNPAFVTSQSLNFHQAIDSADTFDVMLLSKNPKTGCVDSTVLKDGIVVLLNTGGVYEISGLEVYPNPSSGLLNVRTNNSSTTHIEIVNMAGQKVYKTQDKTTAITIDINILEAGTYLLRIKQEHLIHTQLLMKK